MRDALKSAPWNAQIPKNWERRSLKYCARMKGRLGWQNLRADEYTDEGPFLVTSEHFKDDHVEWGRCYHVTEERYAMAPEIQLRPRDVFFMKDGAAMGKLAYVDKLPGPACLNSHLLLLRPRRDEFTTRFLYYVLRSPLFQEFIATQATGTTFMGISQESVGTFPLPLPPLSTQRAIAAFLDRETGRLDQLVAKKRELIERLKEKRTALISRAVTRGLPPAAARVAGLPENPPLKESGLDWLGDIPAHWETMMLKRTWAVCEYGISESLSGEGCVRVLTMGNIQDGCVLIPNEGCLDGVPNKMLLKDGDLLFNRTNSMVHVGKVGIFRPQNDEPVTFASYLVRLRTNERATPEFMNYLLNTSQVLELGRSLALPSINQANLNPTRYGQISIPLPPLPEQAAIAAYLDAETAKLDALVGKVEEAVARLQEYRTALITAAVTGKIDVRPNPNRTRIAS